MDLILLVLVVGIVCFFVWWITTTLITHPRVVQVIWLLTAVVLAFYVLRQLGIAIPNVIAR